ncbi:MAG: 3-oxoacyl-ACP synthase III family protein, partial [Planctomycetota bacterium]
MKARINHDVSVLGTGSYLPERVITNKVLEDLCSNFDSERAGDFSAWVDRVTHITERRFIAEDETTADMGAKAAQQALDMAELKATDLDLIIHATFTPSVCVPGDHSLLADLIGAKATANFTLTGACAGSIYGMAMAYGMLASGSMQNVMVVGAETISPTLDFSDPLTAILFGDGAGAVIMGAGASGEGGMLPPNVGFEFNHENITMGNANMPYAGNCVRPGKNGEPDTVQKSYLKMIAGPSVLRNAVNTMAACAYKNLGYEDGKSPKNGELDELRARMRLVPHQANGRIIDGLTKKMSIDPQRTTKTIHKVGNI